MLYPIALGMPGGAEWIMIAAVGLLLFGKRLPEVGKSLGKGIVEFKKGLKGVEEEISQVDEDTPPARITDQTATSTAGDAGHNFDPYTGKPLKPAHKFDPYTGKPLTDEAGSE